MPARDQSGAGGLQGPRGSRHAAALEPAQGGESSAAKEKGAVLHPQGSGWRPPASPAITDEVELTQAGTGARAPGSCQPLLPAWSALGHGVLAAGSPLHSPPLLRRGFGDHGGPGDGGTLRGEHRGTGSAAKEKGVSARSREAGRQPDQNHPPTGNRSHRKPARFCRGKPFQEG